MKVKKNLTSIFSAGFLLFAPGIYFIYREDIYSYQREKFGNYKSTNDKELI
jgi:hypothetical protein